MPPSLEDLAHTRMEFLEDSLRRMDQRHASVTHALEDAREELERVKRNVDALSLEDEAMRASCAALRADIAALRVESEREKRELAAARARKVLAKFPLEIMQAIFLEASSLEHDLWPAGDRPVRKITYDPTDASTPFSIASVSRRWRTLALATPDIWTCITVGSFGSDGSTCLERVEAMLSRSKERRICIMVCWASEDWDASAYYEKILDSLAEHAHRWRRVSLFFAHDTPESALDFLHRPMGYLEDLVISSDSSAVLDWSSPSKCLPLYPSLRRLDNNVLFSIPRQPLTKLIYLYLIHDGGSPIDIWAVLRLAPSLVDLRIEVLTVVRDWSTGPPPTVTLPVLRSLGLYGQWKPPATWLDSLQLPQLESLMFPINRLSTFSRMFDAVAQTVTSLEIEGACAKAHFLATHVDELRKLPQLRHLIFSDCTFVGRDIPTALASREAAGLPQLKQISFPRPILDDKQAHHLANLMQSICAGTPHAQDGMAFSMEAKAGNVPDWLLQQYRFLGLGAHDGRSHSMSQA